MASPLVQPALEYVIIITRGRTLGSLSTKLTPEESRHQVCCDGVSFSTTCPGVCDNHNMTKETILKYLSTKPIPQKNFSTECEMEQCAPGVVVDNHNPRKYTNSLSTKLNPSPLYLMSANPGWMLLYLRSLGPWRNLINAVFGRCQGNKESLLTLKKVSSKWMSRGYFQPILTSHLFIVLTSIYD